MEMMDLKIQNIIKMLYAQYPSQKRSDVVNALKDCSRGDWVSDNYICYLDPLKNGDEWNLKERVSLNTEEGNIFIDLMQDGRIGGIEFDFKVLWTK